MAMSATCTITNNTGVTIAFASVSQVNDDSTWNVQPPAGTPIPNGGTCTISMGNSSVLPFVRGVGFNAKFMDSDFNIGGIYFDDPAVGSASFQYNGSFKYQEENPSGNVYTVSITK